MLALLYTVSVLGVALNFHYCLNQVTAVKIYSTVKSCTPLKAAKPMKCCKDKHLDIKVKDGHQASSINFEAKTFVVALPLAAYNDVAAKFALLNVNQHVKRGPPGNTGNQPPIFLTVRNFRI